VKTHPFKRDLLAYLGGAVKEAEACFDRTSGRFLASNGGWAVTNQDVIFPLALLGAEGAVPAGASDRVLDMLFRGGDALRAWQDPDGRFEFIKVDGSRWGKTYMPWSLYHWLEAYALARGSLSPARRRRWEDGLRLGFAGIAREMAAGAKAAGIHNITTWNGMSLARAGTVFGEPSWTDRGAETIRRAAGAQHPDGFWPENHGPTTTYNLVYLHAMGLHLHFTGDRSLAPVVERANRFHVRFTYPDGSAVETVDGRVRYHRRVLVHGWPGLCATAEGRALLRRLLRVAAVDAGGPGESGLQAAAQRIHRYPAHAAAYACWPAGADAGEAAGTDAPVRTVHGGALVRRDRGWYLCMNGYLTPPEKRASVFNRWHLERQSYLSVFHDRAGLIVGGGNSRGQKELSTFIVWDRGVPRYQADAAAFSRAGAADILTLRYGRTVCAVRAAIRSARELEIAFKADPAPGVAAVHACFSLLFEPGLEARASFGEPFAPDTGREWHGAWPGGGWFEQRGVRMGMAPGTVVVWPYYPFNPYAINDASPPEDAVAAAVAALRPGRWARFTLSLR